MSFITKKSKLEKKIEIYIITDVEPALIAAYLKSFSKGSLLRCTRHFEVNCKDFLIGISNKGKIKDPMLDVVFGEHGLAEAQKPTRFKGKNERCYYFAAGNGKTVFTIGRALKQ